MEKQDYQILTQLIEKYSISKILDQLAEYCLSIANSSISIEDKNKTELYSKALELLEDTFHQMDDLEL